MPDTLWDKVDSYVDKGSKFNLLLGVLKRAADTGDPTACKVYNFALWLDNTPFDQLDQPDGFATHAITLIMRVNGLSKY